MSHRQLQKTSLIPSSSFQYATINATAKQQVKRDHASVSSLDELHAKSDIKTKSLRSSQQLYLKQPLLIVPNEKIVMKNR